jgi:hypothetical protein
MTPQLSQLRAKVDHDLATRLLKRFLGAIIEAAAPHDLIQSRPKRARAAWQ